MDDNLRSTPTDLLRLWFIIRFIFICLLLFFKKRKKSWQYGRAAVRTCSPGVRWSGGKDGLWVSSVFALTHASCFGDVRYVGGVKRRARVISVLKGKFVVLSGRDRCRLRQHLSSISVFELKKKRNPVFLVQPWWIIQLQVKWECNFSRVTEAAGVNNRLDQTLGSVTILKHTHDVCFPLCHSSPVASRGCRVTTGVLHKICKSAAQSLTCKANSWPSCFARN